MGLPDPPVEYIIGQVARLRGAFKDEERNAADPSTDVTIRIIDHDNAIVVDITEAIGSLSLIQREGSVGEGVFFYRHTVVSGDSTRDEYWQYKFLSTSSGGAIAAFGSITAVDPSNYTDGQAFTLDDGVNTPTRFGTPVSPRVFCLKPQYIQGQTVLVGWVVR